jgi:disulfide bond formation protein DsbB
LQNAVDRGIKAKSYNWRPTRTKEVLMSDMKSWLKAGLIGAAVIVVLEMLGIIPCVCCVTWLLEYVAYGCIGALAAYWMPPERLPGPAARDGALAGAIAGAIGGAVGLIIALGTVTVFAPLGPLAGALEGTGFDPSVLVEMFASVVGTVTCGSVLYVIGVGIAAGLGALGAVIFAAARPE